MPVDFMEPRPTLTPEILDLLSDRFGLNLSSEPADLGGWFSLNVLVETPEQRYVARVHGTQTEPARLTAIQQTRRYLAHRGVPTATGVPATDGEPFVDAGGHLLEVERYVDHDADMDTWDRLERGLPDLGRTHALLHSHRVGAAGRHAPLANHIEPHHALAGTLRGVERLRSWHLSADDLALAASFERLARLVDGAEGDTVADLPRQLVHGDFWGNNVLFRGGAVAAVLDLDFMAERLRIDDFALTLFFANSTVGGDRLSRERMRQLRTLVDAYDSGLSNHLSSAERRALPAAIARQALWSIGWWVPRIPDVEVARRNAVERAIDVEWTLGLMENVEEWQAMFAADGKPA